MNKINTSLSLFFFLTLIFLFLSPLQASSVKDYPWEKARQIVYEELKSRDGVVLWWDLKTGEEKVLGNPQLLDQKFLPGSVMKLITAEAAVLSQRSFRYDCHGHEEFSGETLWCWDPNGHGALDLPKALSISCNLYFVQLAHQLGWEYLKEVFINYSFAASQNLTSSPPFLNSLVIGEALSFQVTPREMKKFWNQFLTKLENKDYASIKLGLEWAAEHGTAKLASKGLKFEILAKTGTAGSLRQNYKTNAWLLAAYPAEEPRFALVLFMKNARGYDAAARLAQKLIKVLS